jgi:hypothetical protein
MEQVKLMRVIAIVLVFAAALGLSGCANSPQGGPGAARRLVIEMQVAGVINPNYHYFVAIDNDSNPSDGPVAVTNGPPWGNGWVAGSVTHYVEYNGSIGQGGYGLYRIPDAGLVDKNYLGPPENFVTPGPSGNTLTFTIDLDSLALPPQASGNDIQTLEINFITTDDVPNNNAINALRQWDALGDHRSNLFLQLNITPGRIYSNDTEGIEPEGDVPKPDLDIVNWSIEVQQL